MNSVYDYCAHYESSQLGICKSLIRTVSHLMIPLIFLVRNSLWSLVGWYTMLCEFWTSTKSSRMRVVIVSGAGEASR